MTNARDGMNYAPPFSMTEKVVAPGDFVFAASHFDHGHIFGQIEGAIAKILEARLDDNASATGRVQSQDSLTNDMDAGSAPAASYQDSSRYDMAFRL